ncbi:GPI mannosyltransferase 2, putative [Plasmodium gallinaceum]|uniref:GPI mannosyltransferase 2 n=1 Tax=Plasmodium gallinaceum TaxID=5849 RepID=A0A1J1GX08_PLAGA|nr:GPI mannosyltransferase 2, putative [Plasmodium gallinaceum]CRG97099.1 GPI mannosyltransferase 2, putative [Plasmodium gallinaceum]
MHRHIIKRQKFQFLSHYKDNTSVHILLVIIIATIIRIFCIIYTVLWSKLISSYKLSNNLLCENGTLWEYIKCFSYWDGEYFLRLSLNKIEYSYEQNHAFFPSLPLIIIFTKKLFMKSILNTDNCAINVLIAVIINNIFFVIATIGIYVFSLIHLMNRKNYENKPALMINEQSCFYLSNIKDEKECYSFSFFLSVLYSFTSGNIHVSSFYNESIFSCFSIWGFNFLKLSSTNNMCPFFEILAVLSFFIASSFRSNGILFLIPLFFYNINSCKFCQYYIKSKTEKKKNIIFSYFSFKRNIFYFIIHWLKALIEAFIVIFPFLIFQIYSYHLYCAQHNDLWKEQNKTFYLFLINFIKNPFSYINIWNNKSMLINRPWCNKNFPFIYNYIQHKYWDVSFLKILKAPNFNIIYSAPIYYISFHCVFNFFKYYNFSLHGFSLLFNQFFGCIVHLCIFSFYILLFAHNEIILRLIISSPIFFLHYAYLLKYFENWNYLLFINLFYFFVGPPLFGTYIAWT